MQCPHGLPLWAHEMLVYPHKWVSATYWHIFTHCKHLQASVFGTHTWAQAPVFVHCGFSVHFCWSLSGWTECKCASVFIRLFLTLYRLNFKKSCDGRMSTSRCFCCFASANYPLVFLNENLTLWQKALSQGSVSLSLCWFDWSFIGPRTSLRLAEIVPRRF